MLSPIPFHIAGVFLPPFFLAVPTLLLIHQVRGELLPMVVGAASPLAVCGTANSLIWTVAGRIEFLFALGARLFFHAYGQHEKSALGYERSIKS